MPVSRSRAAIAAAFAIALTGAGAGCSDDGSDDAGTATTVALEADDDAAVDEGTDDPDVEDDDEDEGATTTTTVVGVAAATGPVLEQPLLSLHMPEGWELDEIQARFLTSGNSGDLELGNMGLSQLRSPTPATTDDVEQAMIDSRFQGQGSVLPRVEVAGVEMAHVAGPSGLRVDEAYGALVDGQIVNIVISLRPEIPEAERRAIIDSVLASVTWN